MSLNLTQWCLLTFCALCQVMKCRQVENSGEPSTISSASSVKNSLSGGLLGLFRVLRSCWIFVDTRLFTGTPASRTRTEGGEEKCNDTQIRTRHYLLKHLPIPKSAAFNPKTQQMLHLLVTIFVFKSLY